MKKIKITESDLYNIIKQVLLEQEEDVWYTDKEDFNFRLFKTFDGDSEKFAKYHNKFYEKIVVDGYLDLSNTPITSLPNNIEVDSSLWLRSTPIKSLPDNLKVDKDLGIQFTEIKTLPDSLFVKNKIYIYFTPLNDNDELVKEYMKYYDFDRYRP